MKKIGFLVQRDFLSAHFGVRNFFSAIAEVCAEQYQMDYLVHDCTPEGVFWYIVNPVSGPYESSIASHALEFDLEKDLHYLSYGDFKRFIDQGNATPLIPKQFYRSIGPSLEGENYDLLVITNPWVVDFDMPLPAKRVMGIVHDLIANQFSLTKPTLDYTWAAEHNRGYMYYCQYCTDIFANSQDSANQFNLFYHSDKCKYFKPFPPYAFRNVEYKNEKKENAVLLAAPFDLRKGIENMPELLNGADDLIDTLYIYGMPRCEDKVFNAFFSALTVRKIKYYPYLTNRELIALYKKCKVMLFPSLEEGLGIPLIEAQVSGCRVITTDKEPMNTLALRGAYLLSGDRIHDVDEIREMIQSDLFDYAALSKCAKERFSYQNILDEIDNILA